MDEGTAQSGRLEERSWPRWRTRTVLFCALLGTSAGALFGVVAVISKFLIGAGSLLDGSLDGLSMTPTSFLVGLLPFLMIGVIVGSGFGLLCSPILFQQSDRPHFIQRFVIATLLGCMVAFLAGPIVWLGSVLFVGFAAVVSFGQAGRLFQSGWGSANVARVLAGPGLSVLALGGWAFITRLPDDETELIALLGDNDSETREAAASKLQEMAGLEPFLTAFEDPDPEVREQAVRTVGSAELESTVPALMAATKDVNQRVRVAALGALFHMGTEQPLLDVLGDPNSEMTKPLLFRVGWCGDSSHIPALEALLERPDESVRKLAASTIESLRDKASAH